MQPQPSSRKKAVFKRKADHDSFGSSDCDGSDEGSSSELDAHGKGKGKSDPEFRPKRKSKTVDEHGDALMTSTRAGSNLSAIIKETDNAAISSDSDAPLRAKAATAKSKANSDKQLSSSDSDAPLLDDDSDKEDQDPPDAIAAQISNFLASQGNDEADDDFLSRLESMVVPSPAVVARAMTSLRTEKTAATKTSPMPSMSTVATKTPPPRRSVPPKWARSRASCTRDLSDKRRGEQGW